MQPKKLSEKLFVGSQLTIDDTKELIRLGIGGVICTRPDGESDDQTDHFAIETALNEVGIDFRYLPVTIGNITDEDIKAFVDAQTSMSKPVFAYCRTGTRAATLWSYTMLKQRSKQEVLSIVEQAGYDLKNILSAT